MRQLRAFLVALVALTLTAAVLATGTRPRRQQTVLSPTDTHRVGRRVVISSDLPGLVGEWDADAGVTLTSSHVTTWTDQTGLGHNFTQATSALGPTIGTNEVGAHSALKFTVGQYMTVAFTLAQPVTVGLVLKNTPGTSAVNDIFLDGIGLSTFLGLSNSSPITTFNAGSSISFNLAPATYQVMILAGNGASSQVDSGTGGKTIRVSGNAGTGSPGGFTLNGLGGLFTRGCLTGLVHMVAYNSTYAATTVGQQQIATMLGGKFGL